MDNNLLNKRHEANKPQSGVEGEAPTALPVEGATRAPMIDHQYRVLSSLGGGSFSDVFVVADTKHSSGEVALKLLKTGLGGQSSPDAITDFKNEFATLQNLNHPHIARILDFGFDRSLKQYYFTCERVQGANVFEATAGKSVEEILGLFVQALRAFHYLHSYRVYHFDVKAANLLVTDGLDGQLQLKVIDFGLASIDPKGKMIGTPSYMAPEIIAKEKPDGRADLYSLGVLFYYCFTRHNPFRGRGIPETLKNQQILVVPPLSELHHETPKFLDRVFARLLEKNPANRYQRADEILREINFYNPKKYPLETQETLLSYLPDEGRLIGRLREKETYQKCFQGVFSTASTKTLAVLMLEGMVGLGKTRLLKEFKYIAQLQGVSTVSASVLSAGDLDSWLCHFVQHKTQGAPTVFFLDDMDPSPTWSEESEDFQTFRGTLAHLVREDPMERVPFLLVLASSDVSKLPESLHSLLAACGSVTLHLKPFSLEEMKSYVVSLTGLEDLPPKLLEGLTDRTENNPLLVTELLRSLIQEGALFDQTGRWKKTTFDDLGVDFSKARYSGPLEEILLGRFLKLPREEREILEALSVAKMPLKIANLGKLLKKSGDLEGSVTKLLNDGFLDRLEWGGGVSFRNTTMAELIYRHIPESTRRHLHDGIAGLLGDSPEKNHHVMCGSDLQKALRLAVEEAGTHLKAARGREAAEKYRFALGLQENGHAVIPTEEAVELTLKFGEACLTALDYSEALQALENVESILALLPNKVENTHIQVDALLRMGMVYVRLAEFEKSRQCLASALGLLRYLKGDLVRELVAENFRASILFQEGRLVEAREIFEGNLRRWDKELSAEQKKKVMNNDLGMVYLASQEYPQAQRQFLADLNFFQSLENPLILARIHYNLGQTFLGLKHLEGAVSHYEETVRLTQPLRNTELLLRAYNGLGNTLNLMGRGEEALRYYERGLDLSERTGDLRSQTALLVNMGLIESTQGNFRKAERFLDPAIGLLKNVKQRLAIDWQTLTRALLEKGDISRREKRWSDAEKMLKEALDLSESHEGAKPLRFWILNTMSELYLERGEPLEAQKLLSEVKKAAQTPDEIGQISQLEDTMNKSLRTAEGPQSTQTARTTQTAKTGENSYAYILEINKFINADPDLPFVLKTVLNYALDLSQAEGGAILLLNTKGELEVASSRNLEDLSEVSRSIANKVLETGEWLQTENAAGDPRFQSEASVARLDLKSVLCFPIISRRKTIGIIYLDNRLLSNAFEHADVEVLKAFGEQVGIAIENARLLKGYEEKSRVLEDKVGEMSSQIEQFQSLVHMSQRNIETRYNYDNIIARSKPMIEIFRLLDKITDTDLAVFIHGESGTGKELIARALHYNSSHSKKRFVAVNCGALPPNLIESELFGARAGAFTGATRDRKGLFEEADGGTIFLDEVAEIDISLQAKLLRVAQEGEYYRVGDSQPIRSNARIVSASNKDLLHLVKETKFREDLFYRLCQIRIDLPSLRERREDIPLLAAHFIREEAGKSLKVSTRLMKAFLEYDWPGNIREFENLIKVAVALSEEGVVDAKAIPSNYGISRLLTRNRNGSTPSGEEVCAAAPPIEATTLPQAQGTARAPMIDKENRYDPGKNWYDYEKLIIAKAYQASDFNARKASVTLGIAIATLYKKIKEWNLSEKNNPLYKDAFQYDPKKPLKDYLKPVFQAALTYVGDKPYKAIANLKVSQGYFYGIMKEKN